MSSNNFYAYLSKIDHPPTRQLVKLILDKINTLDTAQSTFALKSQITPGLTTAQVNALLNPTQQLLTKVFNKVFPPQKGFANTGSSGGGGGGGGGGAANTDITKGQPGGVPPRPNKRWFRGNMDGIRVPGLPFVQGGLAEDTTQFISWFLDRYDNPTQQTILNEYAGAPRNYTHILLSWPDSRTHGGTSFNGVSASQFAATCQLCQQNGLFPVIFCLSKDYDPPNPDDGYLSSTVDPMINAVLAVCQNPIFCVGWELNSFMDPQSVSGPAGIQIPINHIANIVVPAGAPLYVHFTQGVASWQPNGQFTSYFWNTNVGKLTGLLHQKVSCGGQNWDDALYQARLADIQSRFAGTNGFVNDSGFGHPFDLVALEITACLQFQPPPNELSEAGGDHVGFIAICSPPPSPGVPVMGYLNGCTNYI